MIQPRMMSSPAGTLLVQLQRKGPQTIKELEQGLGVTATAVRQQIAALLADDYIQQAVEHTPRGRPRHVYTLTPQGHALFPQHYDELTYTLLHEILLTEGPQKVQLLLQKMSQRLAEQYSGQIESDELAVRARELTELLNAKGIMAEVEVNPQAIFFREFNCPYYQLAREYRAICNMEEGMIAHVLKQPVSLVSCSLDGHHGCQFKIDNES
ncbi:MAG TPA: transcriptional regulator [Anaerolineae bacterium]